MAKITYLDDTTEYVDYNTAAKIYQILEDNEEVLTKEEVTRLKPKAEKIKKIDFKILRES